MKLIQLCSFDDLQEKTPAHHLVNGLDLVSIRYGNDVSVLYGRCLHRGALMADGHIDGDNLICGVHGWDYRYDTGVSEYDNKEVLHKFTTEIKEGQVLIDEDEIDALINDFFISPEKIAIAVSGTPLDNISQQCYKVINFYTKVRISFLLQNQ